MDILFCYTVIFVIRLQILGKSFFSTININISTRKSTLKVLLKKLISKFRHFVLSTYFIQWLYFKEKKNANLRVIYIEQPVETHIHTERNVDQILMHLFKAIIGCCQTVDDIWNTKQLIVLVQFVLLENFICCIQL